MLQTLKPRMKQEQKKNMLGFGVRGFQGYLMNI